MSVAIQILEGIFIVVMLGLVALWLASLAMTWGWALHYVSKKPELFDLLRTASIEWGALVSLIFCHALRLDHYHEVPPLDDLDAAPQQLPVIFVPSLHTRGRVFWFLFWRMKNRHWASLWILDWKSFLSDANLLEDQLRAFIHAVLEKTRARRFRLISFGTSRPLVSRVLNDQSLQSYCDRWIAISAPERLSAPYHLLESKRRRSVYQPAGNSGKKPDMLILGDEDLLCYPTDVFGEGRLVSVSGIGHFACLLHSTTTQAILKELSS